MTSSWSALRHAVLASDDVALLHRFVVHPLGTDDLEAHELLLDLLDRDDPRRAAVAARGPSTCGTDPARSTLWPARPGSGPCGQRVCPAPAPAPARHRAAYRPPARTSSSWVPSSAIRPRRTAPRSGPTAGRSAAGGRRRTRSAATPLSLPHRRQHGALGGRVQRAAVALVEDQHVPGRPARPSPTRRAAAGPADRPCPRSPTGVWNPWGSDRTRPSAPTARAAASIRLRRGVRSAAVGDVGATSPVNRCASCGTTPSRDRYPASGKRRTSTPSTRTWPRRCRRTGRSA